MRKIQTVLGIQEYMPFRLSSSTEFCSKPDRLNAEAGMAAMTVTRMLVGTVMAVQ